MKSNMIGFRLDPEMLEVLSTQQAGRESLHDTARRLLLDALQKKLELEILHQDMARLDVELSSMKNMLLAALPGLVMSAGKITKEQAEEWMNVKIRPCFPSPNP